MHLRPQTLRRLARQRRWKALELTRRDQLRERRRIVERALGHPAAVLGTSVVVGVGLLFLPIGYRFGAFTTASGARGFLSTLWQVEGGTIALTLTLIVVAFEAIWRSRFRGSVRRFSEEVWLLYALAAAFVSLITIAVCLLGWGHGAPGGWAATWSVCLSAIAFAAVPVTLVRTLLLMNPAEVHERRIEQLRGEVHDAVDQEAFERLAYGELKDRAERDSAIALQPIFIGNVPSGMVSIEATKAGVVSDIRIGRLLRIANKLQQRDEETLVVATALGQYVARSGAVALVASSASAWRQWRIRRAFTTDTRARRSRLYDVISHLHQETLQSIREVQPSTYDDIAELWVELLLALPAAWRRYGHSFDEALAGEFGRFGFGPVDQAAKDLFIEAREATKSMDDIAADAFMLPDRIAMRSLEYDAPALLLRMLALYVELYPTAAEVENGRLRERLLALVFALPQQLGRHTEYDLQRIDLPINEREQAEKRLKLVFRTIAELLKAIADHDPNDTARAGKVNSSWSEIFGSWHPEHDREEEWPNLPAEEIARRQAHNAAVDVLAASKTELEHLRDTYRFGLAYWALHQLEQTDDPSWAEMLKVFLPWLGSVERLAAEAGDVIEMDLDTRLFLQWHQTNVQVGWAAPRAFIVFVLLQHAPDQIPGDIGVPRFLRGTMSTEIEQTLDAVAANDHLWQLLGGAPADLDVRVERLRSAIRAAGRAARAELGLPQEPDE
jgi:hypothetical protein